MYFYIMCFQCACILVSGVCLYLAVTDGRLRMEKYGMSVLAVLSGIFLMEAGYGLYLQEIAMAGLRTAEKVCLFGKLLAGTGFFVTCVSLSGRDSVAIKTAAGISGLTAAVFLFSDGLNRLLYLEQEFLQNQFFYYIETERTALGEIFRVFMRCMPLFGVLWFAFRNRGRKKRKAPEMLLLAGVLFWAASSICQKMAFLRHYDADMPFGAAFAVCMMIFVAWDTKRVYTGSDAGSGDR
jgi:drug/metabolite transporter (DMT)-like permease